MAPSVLAMANNFEDEVFESAPDPKAPPSVLAIARNYEAHKASKRVVPRQQIPGSGPASLDSQHSSDYEDALSPGLMSESTSWKSPRPPSSPITFSSPSSSATSQQRSPSPPKESPLPADPYEALCTGRVKSDVPETRRNNEKTRELRTPAKRVSRQAGDIQSAAARRMLSGHATSESRDVPRPTPMRRQWSQLSAATDQSEGRRKSSFSRQFRLSRRDSQDSMMSGASEPVSYSNNLYVSSDIWIAEKKLDNVEGEIMQREDDKARRRGVPRRDVHDAFGEDAESQNFSSRLVGLLWSNPVTANPSVNTARGDRRHAGSVRRNGRRGRGQARERGAVGKEGKFMASDQMGDNMPGALPHVFSNVGRGQHQTKEEVASQDLARKQMGYNVREIAKKADPARWFRRHAHRRAERRDIY